MVGFLTVCMGRLGVDLRDQCKDVPPPRLPLRTKLPQILERAIKLTDYNFSYIPRHHYRFCLV